MAFFPFFMYTWVMKKSIFILLIGMCSLLSYAKDPVYADDYLFQKQLLVGAKDTCQAVLIAKNWFLTAAHCVTPCMGKKCRLQIVLAAGEISALTEISAADIVIPQGYQTTDKNGKLVTHTYWDVALMHYHPKEVFFQNQNGEEVSADRFKQALAEDEDLNAQWKGVVKPKYPTLYSFARVKDTPLKTDLFVPLWERGEMSLLSEPEQILYLGENQSLWASAGFGVDHGNSGGGVFLPDGGLLGIATAKRVNDLPEEVRRDYPAFAENEEFLLFNGFSPNTTLEFIKRTLYNFGASVKTKELRMQEMK